MVGRSVGECRISVKDEGKAVRPQKEEVRGEASVLVTLRTAASSA